MVLVMSGGEANVLCEGKVESYLNPKVSSRAGEQNSPYELEVRVYNDGRELRAAKSRHREGGEERTRFPKRLPKEEATANLAERFGSTNTHPEGLTLNNDSLPMDIRHQDVTGYTPSWERRRNDLGMSSEDECRIRRVKGKQLLAASLATVADIQGANRKRQSLENPYNRQNVVQEGEVTLEEARKFKAKAALQAAATLGATAPGIEGAIPKIGEAQITRQDEEGDRINTARALPAEVLGLPDILGVEGSPEEKDLNPQPYKNEGPDTIATCDEESHSTTLKKNESQRFYCTEYPPCTLSFTRWELLARHVRYGPLLP
jgi:hypothetical protein